MPIQIQWFDDQHQIILWTVQGQWTLHELHKAYDEGNALCEQYPQNIINVLVDMRNSQAVPTSIFSTLSNRVHTEKSNYDMAVIVTQNVLIKSFCTIINTLPVLRGKFEVRDTINDALAFIEKRRQERSAGGEIRKILPV